MDNRRLKVVYLLMNTNKKTDLSVIFYDRQKDEYHLVCIVCPVTNWPSWSVKIIQDCLVFIFQVSSNGFVMLETKSLDSNYRYKGWHDNDLKNVFIRLYESRVLFSSLINSLNNYLILCHSYIMILALSLQNMTSIFSLPFLVNYKLIILLDKFYNM